MNDIWIGLTMLEIMVSIISFQSSVTLIGGHFVSEIKIAFCIIASKIVPTCSIVYLQTELRKLMNRIRIYQKIVCENLTSFVKIKLIYFKLVFFWGFRNLFQQSQISGLNVPKNSFSLFNRLIFDYKIRHNSCIINRNISESYPF